MPVFRSVELNVVDCAQAGRVLRARTAAAMRSEGSRERFIGRMFLMIFIRVVVLFFLILATIHSLHYPAILAEEKISLCGRDTRCGDSPCKSFGMNKTIDTNKLNQLQKLNTLLPHEIRGQSQVLPRIVSAVQRGEFGLTKPGRPRGSFLLLGPTGVGKTETVIVTTNQIFGPGQLFRFDMSEFQNQEALGLLLGARLGEVGYLGAVRERAAEGSLLFDEAEKAHPRVLDILLQLLDAARITVATGQTLDFSNYYIWLTSNIGSAELMSLQHSNEATLERHVLTRAQQSLRPEIFARVNEKLVFRRLSYEHQLEIAEKFLAREIEFLRERGHKLELDKTVLPFLVRKGFHPKLGARPMRDAVEKLVGDAVSECLLQERPTSGALTFDEMRDCLMVL